jgi:5-methylcytosine-specific restriction endonuclease McrA
MPLLNTLFSLLQQWNMTMAKASSRDYVRERLNESPQRKKARVMRNQARQELIKEGKVHVGDGKVVDHKHPLSKGGSGKRSNLRVMSKASQDSQGGKLQSKAAKARGGRN